MIRSAVVLHQIEGKVNLEKGSVLLSAGAKTDRGSESGGGTGTDHVAIVGPTGCGKTTLINLLMRFYDVNAGSCVRGRYRISGM